MNDIRECTGQRVNGQNDPNTPGVEYVIYTLTHHDPYSTTSMYRHGHMAVGHGTTNTLIDRMVSAVGCAQVGRTYSQQFHFGVLQHGGLQSHIHARSKSVTDTPD